MYLKRAESEDFFIHKTPCEKEADPWKGVHWSVLYMCDKWQQNLFKSCKKNHVGCMT